ncbi:CDP-alcohol phosphatidyltransferase family protein [Patescibacteria group bacterium]|nr:CDP-alcohol phosphatidyltransferase family protein [Patescibacteria group bacterium]
MKRKFFTIPNGVTLFSLLLFFPGISFFIFREKFADPILIGWIGIMIVTACRLLDLVDGWLARRNSEVSEFGKWFDPLVDKIQIYGSLIVLWPTVGPWLFWLMLARDLAKTVVRSHGACDVAAGKSDKKKALLQSLALLPLAAGLLHDNSELILLGNCLLAGAVGFSSIWLAKYARQNPANGMSFANFFCGFFAVGFAIEKLFGLAIFSIFVGAIADNLDGRIARRLGTADDGFGGLLDDYADFSNFGVAPAILAASYSGWSMTGISVGIFYIFATAGRLWHFTANKNRKPDGFFFGLPSPAGAAIVCAAILAGWSAEIVLGTTITACGLMVCFPVFWPHFNYLAATRKKSELGLLAVCTITAIVIFNSPLAAPAGMLAVYLLSPFWRRPKFSTAT